LFLSREQWVAFGNPAEDWDRYNDVERGRMDEAAAQLMRMGIDAVVEAGASGDERLKALQRRFEEVRAVMRDEAVAEVELRQVERLRSFLKDGTMTDAEGVTSQEKRKVHKLDRRALIEMPAALTELETWINGEVQAAQRKLDILVGMEKQQLRVLA
jgi:hypothetical protein